MTGPSVLWIDAGAGVAGDMLLGALVDLGVPLPSLQAAVDAVLPGATTLVATTVSRAGLRATKVDVELGEPPDHRVQPRTWATIRALLETAELASTVRDGALATFERLAVAEGRVHAVPAQDVHFHEVGAVDAIADVVGTCAGLVWLDLDEVVLSPVALGAGTVRSEHGELPVPAPAVLELSRGWDVLGGTGTGTSGIGELATPTGLALVTSAADASGPMPSMRVTGIGIGAGSRDRPDRANVVRLVTGTRTSAGADPADAQRVGADPVGAQSVGAQTAVVLETNIDDLDPRLWPDVLARLLSAGALDAWLSPILMKKGRPAHTLHALVRPDDEAAIADVILTHTSTLGLRSMRVDRDVLARAWADVDLLGGTVRVKVGHRGDRIVQAMPEFEDVAELARRTGLPVAAALVEARSAAAANGLVPGAPWPAVSPPS